MQSAALLLGLFLAITASPVGAAEAPSQLAGRAIVERDCGGCHAVADKGESAMAAAPAFRTLGERYKVEGLAESLAEGIYVGHPTMPVRAYPADQVAQIVAYLKTLQPSASPSKSR